VAGVGGGPQRGRAAHPVGVLVLLALASFFNRAGDHATARIEQGKHKVVIHVANASLLIRPVST
jgi:hypothetical protein